MNSLSVRKICQITYIFRSFASTVIRTEWGTRGVEHTLDLSTRTYRI